MIQTVFDGSTFYQFICIGSHDGATAALHLPLAVRSIRCPFPCLQCQGATATGRAAPQGVRTMGPGVVCAVRSCNNRSMHGKQLSFFRFPRDPHLCCEWIALCRRADLDILFQQHGSVPLNLSYRVCSEHFQESDYRNRNLKSQGLKRDTAPSRNLGPRTAWQCRQECKHPGNSACFERKFFDDGEDSSTVPAPTSSMLGLSTQSLPPEPETTDCAKEVDIDSVEVITGIDADKSVDACLSSPPASPAFEYEQSPDNILPDPSEEDACPDDPHLQSDGVESHASEGNDLDYSSPESDSDDEEATMMNIDTLPVEELRTSLRNVYRKYRRLKAVHLETTQLLEESSGKVERLEAALSELRLGHRDAS